MKYQIAVKMGTFAVLLALTVPMAQAFDQATQEREGTAQPQQFNTTETSPLQQEFLQTAPSEVGRTEREVRPQQNNVQPARPDLEPQAFQQTETNSSHVEQGRRTTELERREAQAQPLAGERHKADIFEAALNAGSFNTFANALRETGLDQTLRGPGEYTLFAPTDEAFAKLPPEKLAELMRPENRDKLRKVLSYHIVNGRVMSSDVAKLKSAKTLEGKSVKISAKKGVMVNDARVIEKEVHADENGIIHAIDKVLMP